MNFETEEVKMEIVTLGEMLIDMFPSQIGLNLVKVPAFHPKPGGAPANVAVAAARLGKKSAFIGKVGSDAFGHFLVDTLAQEGVETRGMRLDHEARTTMAFIALPDEHTAEFLFYRNPGADMLLRIDELDRDLLQQTHAFHFGSISLISEPGRSATIEAARIARDSGSLISLDVNYRPSLWFAADDPAAVIKEIIPKVDLVKVNEAELLYLTDNEDLVTGSRILLESGPDLCVVTLGADGSYFNTLAGDGRIPPFLVNTVDSVGCGDAFTAGLLSQLVTAANWRDQLTPARLSEILRYANAVGALTAQKQGVIPALPTAVEVEKFLQTASQLRSSETEKDQQLPADV
jgi:sugar/nucleoside kinase (ribokinase family)